MTPMDISLSMTVELAPLVLGLVAALAVCGVAVIACTEAPALIRDACAAFVSRARVRLQMFHVMKPRIRNAA